MELINLLSAMFSQITGSLAFPYILILVNVLIFAWEAIPQLPSRLIPIVAMLLGAVLFPCFVSMGTVAPEFPHPRLVLITNGFLAGLIAFALHAAVISFLRSKLGWPPPANPPPTN